MDHAHSPSPFTDDVELVPASPPVSFDFISDPQLPHTPSYAGSYNNSPYSVHSELSFEEGDNINFGLFASGTEGTATYDPSEYDNPSGGSLLMFNDSDYLSSYDPQSSMNMHQQPYDYSSPASSNGGGDSGNEQANNNRSRASSVSSNHHHLSPSPHLQPQHLSPSPRMSVAQSFQDMSFQSPSWNPESLPIVDNSPHQAQFPHRQHQQQPTSRSISPNHLGVQQKPQSPPRLLMPDSDEAFPQPPSINAPDGDGDDGSGGGPRLNIVPATPVSGGGAINEGSGMQFRNGASLAPGSQSWEQPQRHHSLSPTPQHQANTSSSSSQPGTSKSSNGFLFPQGNPRSSRSKSDGALEPPTWDTSASSSSLMNDSAIMDDGPSAGGVSMNDVSPSSPPPPRRPGLGGMNTHFTFGGSPTNTTGSGNGFLSPDASLRRSKSDGYGRPGHRQSRSEDYRFGLGVPEGERDPNGLVFPHDDFARHQQHLRNQQYLSPADGPLGVRNGHSQNYSFSGSPSNSQLELGLSGSQLPNLGAGMGLNHLGPSGQIRRPASSVGHYRRASSTSRSERGTARGENYEDGGGATGGGGSVRASPYPSPHVSPRGGYQDLPPTSDYQPSHQRSLSGSAAGTPLLGVQHPPLPGPNTLFGGSGSGMGVPPTLPHPSMFNGSMGGMNIGNMGMGSNPMNNMGGGLGAFGGNGAPSGAPSGPVGPNGLPLQTVTVGGSTVPLVVSKPNVTTGRTAKASHIRRKQEATFVCPVPGCGSTFTRSFNLKGHIRSHNEEKPFVCHWPGCGKGFARQHDCKRHEQLHTNYRPFTCEGCQKPFARMDALNRHLRSEGGAECQRALEQNGNLSSGANSNASNNDRRRSGSHNRNDNANINNLKDSAPAKSLPIPITMSSGTKIEHQDPSGGWKMEETWPPAGLGVAL